MANPKFLDIPGKDYPDMPWCERCQCWHHSTAEHIKSPVRLPIDGPYEGQAHHMAKAAQSLVLMLNNLDYSVFSLDDAARITAQFHGLINKIEFVQKYPNLDRQ